MNGIGMWPQYGETLLLILAATLSFALPLFVAPIHRARLALREMPEKTHLAIYLDMHKS